MAELLVEGFHVVDDEPCLQSLGEEIFRKSKQNNLRWFRARYQSKFPWENWFF